MADGVRCAARARRGAGRSTACRSRSRICSAPRASQTTAGSRILDGFMPPYESTVTANLWRAGAVMLGKTNLDEFAMGSANVTSAYGPVENPWRRRGDNRPLVPGGSSGGSAAAVAARAALGATGTDTGGSIRQPASFCGIVGLKPTYGRCSRWGIVAFASSLDQAGPMTRTVRDAAIMLQRDGRARSQGFDLGAAAGAGFRGGADRRRSRPAGSASRRNTASTACRPRSRRCGSRASTGSRTPAPTPVEISLPHTKYALPAYYIIAPAEASSNLARYDGVRFGLRVPGDSLDEMYENTRAARLRRRGAAAHADRHLCAVGRLLRRLLPEGAEGARADRPRFRRGVRALRRDPDADRAVAGLCASARRWTIRSRCI